MERSRFLNGPQELDEFTCSICQHVLSHPVVTQCCRQLFCGQCIKEWLSKNKSCPFDRNTLREEQLTDPPRALLNLLNRLTVKCDFAPDGCSATCTLSDLSEHVTKCELNPERACERCGERGRDHDCLNALKASKERVIREKEELAEEVRSLKKKLEAMDRSLQNVNGSDRTLKIVNSRMEASMQEFAINVALDAHRTFRDQPEGRMSTYVRNQFEKRYKSLWNCLVSSSVRWGTSIHHYENHYIYFKVGTFHFMVWESSK